MSYKITLKLYDKNGKWLYTRKTDKRQVILSRLRTADFSKGYLKVEYQNGIAFNDSESRAGKTGLLWCLSTFTEKCLVDTFKNG